MNAALSTTWRSAPPSPSDLYDKDLISGFNHRQANWEFSAGVQHELVQGIALDVGYFRRAWAHFQVTDNTLVGPEDFTAVQHGGANGPAPAERWRLHADRLLRRRAGESQARFATSTRCPTTTASSSSIGTAWTSTVNARLRNGLTLQGGVSTGKTMEDYCEIVRSCRR